MPRVHPLSLLVFIIGVAIGVTGVILAIVFGVSKSNNTCPPCPGSCTAELFNLKVGLKNTVLTWNSSLADPDSSYFQTEALRISLSLQQNIQPLTSSSSSKIYKKTSQLNTATQQNIIINVTRFEQGADGSVIAYGLGAQVGPYINALPSAVIGNVQTQISNSNLSQSTQVSGDATSVCASIDVLTTVTPAQTSTISSTLVSSTSSKPTSTPELPSTGSTSIGTTATPSVGTVGTPSTPELPSTGSTSIGTTATPSVETVGTTGTPEVPSTGSTSIGTTATPSVGTVGTPSTPEVPSPGSTSIGTTATPSVGTVGTTSTPEVPSPGSTSIGTTASPEVSTIGSTSVGTTATPETLTSTPNTVGSLGTTETSEFPTTTVEESTMVSTSIGTSTITPDISTTPQVCSGEAKFNGDIAVVYELLSTDDGKKKAPITAGYIQQILSSNKYLIDGSSTRIILVPYSYSTNYSPEDWTTIKNLDMINALLTFNEKENVGDIPNMASALDVVAGTTGHQGRYGAVFVMGYSDLYVKDSLTQKNNLESLGFELFSISLSPTGDLSPLASSNNTYTLYNSQDSETVENSLANYLVAKSEICLTTPSPSTTPGTPGLSSSSPVPQTTAPTVAPCDGDSKFNGDIAIIYEEVYGKDKNNNDIISLIKQLLTYNNNPYLIDGQTTRILLVPYTFLSSYNQPLWSNIKSVNALNTLLALGISELASSDNPADMSTAMKYAAQLSHNKRFGAAIIIGSSDTYVKDSLSQKDDLQKAGFDIYSISAFGNGDLSPLASSADNIFKVADVSDTTSITTIAQTISSKLVSQSPLCVTNPPATETTTSIPSISSTVTASTEAPCEHDYINLSIAYVYYEDKNPGSSKSNQAYNFLLDHLIPRTRTDMTVMWSNNTHNNAWFPESDTSLVPYPYSKDYSSYGNFGTIGSYNKLSASMQAIQILAQNPPGNELQTALQEAANRLESLNTLQRALVIVANMDVGIDFQSDTIKELKDQNIVISTVRLQTDSSVPDDILGNLATDPSLAFSLFDNTDKDELALKMIPILASHGHMCCNSELCE